MFLFLLFFNFFFSYFYVYDLRMLIVFSCFFYSKNSLFVSLCISTLISTLKMKWFVSSVFFLLLVEIEIAKKLYSLLLLLLLLTWNVNLENSFAFFFVCLVRKSHIGMLLTWSMYTIQTYTLCVLDCWKNRVPCRWCFRNIKFNIILSLLSGGYLFFTNNSSSRLDERCGTKKKIDISQTYITYTQL